VTIPLAEGEREEEKPLAVQSIEKNRLKGQRGSCRQNKNGGNSSSKGVSADHLAGVHGGRCKGGRKGHDVFEAKRVAITLGVKKGAFFRKICAPSCCRHITKHSTKRRKRSSARLIAKITQEARC